jgi:hypothetical protein
MLGIGRVFVDDGSSDKAIAFSGTIIEGVKPYEVASSPCKSVHDFFND